MTKQKPSRKPTKSTKPAKAAKSAKAKPAAKSAPKLAVKAAPKASKKPVKATKAAKPVKATKAAKPVKATKAVKAAKPVKATKVAKPVKATKAAKKPVKPVMAAAKGKVAPTKGKVAPTKGKTGAAKSAKPAAPPRGKLVENGVAKSSSQLTLALDNALKLASAADDAGAAAAQGAQTADGDERSDESSDESEDSEDEPAPLAESPRKIELKALLQASVEQALATARLAHHAAVEGATHEEARPENDKDTRGLEQSYLARGHAQRVAELEAGLASLAEMSVHELADGAPIALGAIVKIDDADHERTFLVAPAGGGMVLPGDITVLTPTSPIGRALLGRGVDDECEVGSGAHARTLTILSVE